MRAGVEEGLADYFAQNDAYKTAFDVLKYSRSEPTTPGYDFVREMVKEAMAAIVDDAKVKPTLDKRSTNANANLAELLKQMKM